VILKILFANAEDSSNIKCQEGVRWSSNQRRPRHVWPNGMLWRRFIPMRLITRSGLLMACVIGLSLCSGRSARASCGDYLHGQHQAGTLADHGMPADHSPVPRCHGPYCQRDNPAPAAPHKAVEIPVSGDAILSVITSLIRQDDSFTLRPMDGVIVEGPADRIFRPPRSI
jgi:hypothetical protein